MYLGINVVLTLLAVLVVCFLSFFWIGSQEQHEQAIQSSSVWFFLNRFLVNLIFILFFIGLTLLLNKVIIKGTQPTAVRRRILLINILVLMIASIVTIYLSMQ